MSEPNLDDLIRQYFTVADDGRVLSCDEGVTIVRREDGDYQVRIDERCLTVTAADLLRVFAARRITITDGSQVGVVGDHAHVEGGIHYGQSGDTFDMSGDFREATIIIKPTIEGRPSFPTPDGRHDFYRHIDPPPHYIPRPEVLDAIRTTLLSGAGSVALTSAVKVALHGMGGIGKTVLARALCDDEAVQEHFSDGILWATLGQTPDLGARLREWIGVLGGVIPETAPTLAQLKARLGDLLCDRACLLIVDDAWHYPHVEHFQAGGARCRLLCTTRDAEVAHALGATVQPVNVLPPDQARALLAEWAGGALDETPSELLAQIIKRLGNLPQALSLAGAQLRTKNPARWLETFDIRKLKARRPETLHDNLALTLALSLDDLDVTARQCYTALSIFKEDEAISFPAMAKLWGAMANLDEDDAADLVDDLAARALLQCDETRVATLHDLLRDLIAAELGQDGALAAHRALLDAYRQTIPNVTLSIAEGPTPWHTAPDDGYFYAHLAYHLDAVNKEAELHALFADDAWLHTRVSADDYRYDGYLADLALAWQRAHEQALTQCTACEPPHAIAKCVHCALIQATVNTLANNYEPELVARAVETGLWSPARGLSVLQQIIDAKKQARMAAMLLATGQPEKSQHMAAIHLGLTAARVISNERDRAEVLAALAPHLEEELLEEGLVIAHAIENEDLRTKVLAALAPYLEGEAQQQTLTQDLATTRTIEEKAYRAWGLAKLAPHLEGEARQQALTEGLTAARTIEDEWHRAWVLTALAPHLEGELLAEGLAAARAIEEEWRRAEILATLVPHLKGELLVEALTVARTIEDEDLRAWVLTARALHLEDEVPKQASCQDLTAACVTEDESIRAWGLTALAPHLEDEVRKQALVEGLTAACAIGDEDLRAMTLAALAPLLEGEVLVKGLAAVHVIEDENFWAVVLTVLAPHLEDKARQQALAQGLTAVRAIEEEWHRAEILTTLAPHLKGELLTEGLAAARTIKDEKGRAETLAVLAPHLEGEARRQALAEGLAAARTIKDEKGRAETLAVLAPHLEGEARRQALAEGLAAARTIKDEKGRAETLAVLAPHLEGEARQQALAEGLAAAREIKNGWGRARPGGASSPPGGRSTG